ncbi:MAG: ribonuclease III [Candidatus Paceibacterota bacterium]
MDLTKLEKIIGHQFKNKDLLKESLTHRSYLNENPSWGANFMSPHNERLEFLGDAVLELSVSEYLFQKYPDYNEGQLTSIRAALVNYQMLAKAAGDIELDKFILLSRGEAKDKGKAREVILANAFEAVLGAVYLDAGYLAAKSFIEKVVIVNLPEVLEKELYRDPKSLLQEIIQEKLKFTPSYQVLSEHGPDHQKIFRVGVFFDGDLAAEGEGASKQEAEVEAAKNALNSISN